MDKDLLIVVLLIVTCQFHPQRSNWTPDLHLSTPYILDSIDRNNWITLYFYLVQVLFWRYLVSRLGMSIQSEMQMSRCVTHECQLCSFHSKITGYKRQKSIDFHVATPYHYYDSCRSFTAATTIDLIILVLLSLWPQHLNCNCKCATSHGQAFARHNHFNNFILKF